MIDNGIIIDEHGPGQEAIRSFELFMNYQFLSVLVKHQRNMTFSKPNGFKKVNTLGVGSKAHGAVKIDYSTYVLKIELDSSAFAVVIEVVLLGQRVQVENQVILSFLVVVLGHVACVVNLF